MELIQSILEILKPSLGIIVVSFLGGFILFGIKLSEHFNRKPTDKHSFMRYLGFTLFIFISLPCLGAIVTSVYLLNGDQIGYILALQLGLTSPAIVQSLVSTAANSMAENQTVTLADGQ
jgi:hypothetical protein